MSNPGQLERVRILIVDDERTNLAILESALRPEGYEVVCAQSGAAACEAARTLPPQLVLLDIRLPDEDGFEVLEALQRLPGMQFVPVILLSGVEDLSAKLRGFALGAVDYIVKPFYREEVKARVRLHLKLSLATNALIAEQTRRLQTLQDAQSRMLVRPENLPAAKFQVFWQPIQEAGGDFYEVLELAPGIHAYFIADVSGHDLGTSLVASAAQALLHQNLGPFNSPRETMQMANKSLVQWLPEGHFLSSTLIVVNRNLKTASIINAGHLPCIYLPVSRPAEVLSVRGDLLGVFPDAEFIPQELSISTGDRLMLFTDGLVESAVNDGWEDNLGRLREAAESLRSEPLGSFVAKIRQIMDNGSSTDDTLILALEI